MNTAKMTEIFTNAVGGTWTYQSMSHGECGVTATFLGEDDRSDAEVVGRVAVDLEDMDVTIFITNEETGQEMQIAKISLMAALAE